MFFLVQYDKKNSKRVAIWTYGTSANARRDQLKLERNYERDGTKISIWLHEAESKEELEQFFPHYFKTPEEIQKKLEDSLFEKE